MPDAELEAIRREPDPLARARRATELLAVYQERVAELAEIRRQAIEAAAEERDLTFAAIAEKLGLSKGRITQIRQSPPAAPDGPPREPRDKDVVGGADQGPDDGSGRRAPESPERGRRGSGAQK